MWGYYVALALRSSRRSKALTALVIALLAFGVSSCMVSYAVFRATASDPLPAKSSRLFVPQIDNVGPAYTYRREPPDMLSYTDAVALWQAHRASRQTLVYGTKWGVESDHHAGQATTVAGDAATADFFPMFDVPFRFGSGWVAGDDTRHATVAVISRDLNDRLFAGANSVGQSIRLDGMAFSVVGVLDDWNPRPRFFDAPTIGIPNAFDDAGDVYIPFSRATDMQKDGKYANCPTASGESGTTNWDAYLHSECTRISAWVELATPADATRYRDYLRHYAGQQQHVGRFNWAPNVRLQNLTDWLAYEKVTPQASTLTLLVSASFLLIILVNVVGLMLASFMRRAPEIGIRRALGASRAAIYRQFLIEGATLGLAGGVFGVALTLASVWGSTGLFEPTIARLMHADASLTALTLLLAIGATVVAALYPTWRAAQTEPAWQIKING